MSLPPLPHSPSPGRTLSKSSVFWILGIILLALLIGGGFYINFLFNQKAEETAALNSKLNAYIAEQEKKASELQRIQQQQKLRSDRVDLFRAEIEAQQKEIQAGNTAAQVGTNIVNDLGALALNNTNIMSLLRRHGISVQPKGGAHAEASPTPSSQASAQKDYKPAIAITESAPFDQDAEIMRLKEARDKLLSSVTQARELQSALEKLATDLLETAKYDPDAATVVQKYGIKQNSPQSR